MKKIACLTIAFLISINAFAQLKKLTLEDCIVKQNQLFRTDKMMGFQWIPNTNQYVYLEDSGKKLMTASVENTKATELMSLSDLNKALQTNLKTFVGLTFKNQNAFIINEGSKYFEYKLTTKSGAKIQELNENDDNTAFDNKKEMMAFTVKNNLFYYAKNQEKIAITQNADENIVSGQSIARNEFGISKGIFWSPNSTYLAFYQKDESEVANYPILDINETHGKLESIKYPMIGQKSEKPKVGIFNLSTKKTVFIAPRGNVDDYLTNLAWTPDEKYILIAEINRAQNEMNLNLYDAQSGQFVRTLFNEKNDNWVQPKDAAFFPSKTSNNFVWISQKNGFNNLYYYDLNGKMLQQLTNNKYVVKDILGANPAGTNIYFTASGENPMNVLAYKVDLKGKQTLLTKDLGVHNFVMNTTATAFFDEYSNHSTPSKSLLLDKNLKPTLLLESKNKFVGYEMGTAEISTIKAADGTTDLYTRLIKPSNFDASKKYPVLVYVYGGPGVQTVTNAYLDGASLWMYWMAEQGYLIYSVDNRGSDGRGFAFESVIHGKLGTNEIDDQMKGVDYLKSLPFVDQNRLAVHGWSYGGFMTTSIMLKKPDVFKVGVAGGPVTDWKFYEAMYGERYMDTPTENQKGFDDSSTLNFVNNLKGKLLLIHGTSDDVVVMQNNFALVKKFVEAGKQVDFFPYPMHKHNVMGKDRLHLMTKVLNYVLEYNK
jgi:dipeptidyl-peptidase-4